MVPRPLSSVVAAAALAAATLVFATGCEDIPDEVELPLPDTELLVEPEAFLGAVPCGNNEGAMRSFVVTLYSHSDEKGSNMTELPSSIAVPCSVAARFREQVTAGKWYSVEIDGYAERAEALIPSDGIDSGKRAMELLELSGQVVTPRWQGRCGYSGPDDLAPVEALDNARSSIEPCLPLEDSQPSASQISLTSAAVLGPGGCGVAPQYDVTSEDGLLPDKSEVSCDGIPLLFATTAGQLYTVYARTSDGTLGTVCQAAAAAGVTQPMSCAAISDSGAMRISLAEVLDGGAQPLCPAGGSFQVMMAGEPLHSAPLGCAEIPVVGPLLAGDYTLDAVTFTADGNPAGSASCTAAVLPGKTATATCSAAMP